MKIKLSLNLPEFKKTIKIKGYRLLDGSLLFDSHPEIDIIVDKKKKQILTYPKEDVGKEAYNAQERVMNYLVKKGIVERSSVRSGGVANSLLCKILAPEDKNINEINVAIFSIYNFLKIEEPYFNFIEDFEEEYESDLLEPSPERSTELGEVPHEERKGSVPPGKYYGYGYGYRPYVYENLKKEKP